MSAWIVSKRHIDYMLTAGLARDVHGQMSWCVPAEAPAEAYQRGSPWGPEAIPHYTSIRRELNYETAGRVGVMLWAENYKSVGHRYDEGDTETEMYEYTPYPGPIKPVQILKAISCYEYQSCEHPKWEQSEAHKFCESLRHLMISKLPGYDNAKWGIA